MKHFEVQYQIGKTCFVYKTTSIADAFDAACDAVAGNGGEISSEKRDEIFVNLAEATKLSGKIPFVNCVGVTFSIHIVIGDEEV